MEQLFNHEELGIIEQPYLEVESTNKPFIQANTMESSLREIKRNHVIPVFIKDNEPVISHADFIESMMEVAASIYPAERLLEPSIRLSHPIKGRVPEAKFKQASELLEHEKTLYFERMAFVVEIPTIFDEIDGNQLSLTVGGVKSYSLDNLYNKKGADEHFKVFIGFQNKVCTNLCVWTDGFQSDLRVKSIGQLKACIRTLFDNYNASYHIHALRCLTNYSLTEHQFATLIGRSRMYNHLPNPIKNDITPLLLSDTQLNVVVKDYYNDNSFCKSLDGNINLWRLYNLFTGTNKSSYIDTFLDRSVNTFSFVEQLKTALDKKETNWFLH
ncbi:DUF3871 family protein [Pinibacter aurantiacus]|uniref:DUF3871 family protein n=1 Tax=Pinibacter aurantiacus TaxID=2851599 RepID=A0A9E2W818_9BACT|nr:DUF3871 family protein [Pinibacter aurantiacus]MBV4357706.1 DUF3871 family protein [Pinibacter aurantiacus]